MREEELPVFGADAVRKYAEHLEARAKKEDGAEVACVGETTCEGADEKDEEDLDGADPGNGGGWKIEGGGIVRLE